MLVKIKRKQRHTVIYTDEYEMTEEEFKKKYKSKEHFLREGYDEGLEDYKVNTIVDEISNRDGTYDEDWEIELID